MSLDTALKRGSAMLLSIPFRPWLTIPDGTIAAADRLSLAYLGASIAAAEAAAVLYPPLLGSLTFGPLLAGAVAFKPKLAGGLDFRETLAGSVAFKPNQ